ncbi:MAG: hypothetical protein GF308_17100 [Candidatus Heimdallarchaeota archaeon]|nr:hypothetical protein [Candidatus Heimdallarchaeota archaeon]
MAIQTIWIIDSYSGVCLYDWYSKSDEQKIDEQLVSGLLMAFRSFSSEAGLVDISEIEGIDKKLAYQASDRYIIASICHAEDYELLVEQTLLAILQAFIQKYKDILAEDSPDVTPFRTFNPTVTKMLKGTTAKRSPLTTTVGAISSMFLVAIVFTVAFLTLGPLNNALDNDSASIIMFVELLIGMFLGGLIGGIVAGDRRRGIIASVSSVIPVLILLIILMQSSWTSLSDKVFYPLLYLVVFGSVIALGGVLGGYLKERRFFYAGDVEEEEEEEEENSISSTID